jgi:RNA binding exosome subunit
MSDEKKDKKPLLMEELSYAKKVALGQTYNTPGFQVIIELFESLLDRANKDVMKLDPEQSDYDRKLSVRTQRQRNFHEAVGTVRDSIHYHINFLKQQAQEEETKAVDAVAKTFGIHTIPAKKKAGPSAAQSPKGTQQN